MSTTWKSGYCARRIYCVKCLFPQAACEFVCHPASLSELLENLKISLLYTNLCLNTVDYYNNSNSNWFNHFVIFNLYIVGFKFCMKFKSRVENSTVSVCLECYQTIRVWLWSLPHFCQELFVELAGPLGTGSYKSPWKITSNLGHALT